MTKQKSLLIFTGAGFSKALNPEFLTTAEIYEKIKNDGQIHDLETFTQSAEGKIRDVEYLARTIYKTLEEHKMIAGSALRGLSSQAGPPLELLNEAVPAPKIKGSFRDKRGGMLDTDALNEITSQYANWQKSLNYINSQVLNKLFDVALNSTAIADFRVFMKDLEASNLKPVIFSTNYDKAIRFLQKNPNYYLQAGSNKVDIDAIINQRHDIDYFPLKGMLDWRLADDEKTIYQGLKIENSVANLVVMVLEDSSNYENLKFPHDMLYKKFKEELQKADCLLFIGFSFRDDFVGQLIKERLQDTNEESKIQKVVIVNQAESGSQELKDLKSNIEKIFAEFSENNKDNFHQDLDGKGFVARTAKKDIIPYLL